MTRLLLCLFLLNSSWPFVLGGEGDTAAGRRERLKEKLGFDEWADRARGDKYLLVLDANAGELFPPGSIVQKIDAPVPTYRVVTKVRTGGEQEGGGATCEVRFIVRIYPSLVRAREDMVSYFEYMAAPIEYARTVWEKQKIKYGDVSFGRDFWSVGNVVFQLESREQAGDMVDKLFTEIDKTIMSLPEHEQADGKAKVEVTHRDGKLELTLSELPDGAAVILSSPKAHVAASASGKFTVAVAGGEAFALDCVTVRAGKAERTRLNLTGVEEEAPAEESGEARPAAPAPRSGLKEE